MTAELGLVRDADEAWVAGLRTTIGARGPDRRDRPRLLGPGRPPSDHAGTGSGNFDAAAVVANQASIVDGKPLSERELAANSYDRAAHAQYGTIPRPTPVGNSLRQTARMLASGGHRWRRRHDTARVLVGGTGSRSPRRPRGPTR
jgi:hypothetical protein